MVAMRALAPSLLHNYWLAAALPLRASDVHTVRSQRLHDASCLYWVRFLIYQTLYFCKNNIINKRFKFVVFVTQSETNVVLQRSQCVSTRHIENSKLVFFSKNANALFAQQSITFFYLLSQHSGVIDMQVLDVQQTPWYILFWLVVVERTFSKV